MKKRKEIKPIKEEFDREEDFVLDEEEDEEIIDEKELCSSSDFAFLGTIKRKSGTYEKVVIVNRWAWRTDNKYRKIYPPIMDILKNKGFKEKGIALVEVDMSKEEIKEYLTSINMRYCTMLEKNALVYLR